MRLILSVFCFALALYPARADEPPRHSEREAVVKFLKDYVIGKTFESAPTMAKIASGNLEAEYSSRSRYANLRETQTGFSFEVLEEINQTNYPIGKDGKRTGPGQDASRRHSTQYELVECLSTGELLGISIIPERTIGPDTFPAVFSAVKFKQRDGRLVMTSFDVWYHDEFSGEAQKRWKPGKADVTQVFTLNEGKCEVRVKVCLFEYNRSSKEKVLDADVSERILRQSVKGKNGWAETKGRRFELRTLCVGANYACVRFERYSGESWLLGNLTWQKIEEAAPIHRSEYEITLVAKGKDFDILRIDRRSGVTWGYTKGKWLRITQPE